jgi:DNA gyrase/topoisomerase IV subunit B
VSIDTTFETVGFREKEEIVSAISNNGERVGQMSTQDIKSSMFGPDQRIEVLTYGKTKKDKRNAQLQLENLMGEDVDGRREFIFDNIDFESIAL